VLRGWNNGDDDAETALLLIPHYCKHFSSPQQKSRWLGLAAGNQYFGAAFVLVLRCLIAHDADPTQVDEDGVFPLVRAMQTRTASKGIYASLARGIDFLAPLTLGKTEHRIEELRKPGVLQFVLRKCSAETVALFVQHVADPLTERELWGSNPVSLALRNDTCDNDEIAQYLYSMGVRDEEPSHKCLRWMKRTGKLREGDPGWDIAEGDSDGESWSVYSAEMVDESGDEMNQSDTEEGRGMTDGSVSTNA
jgi:hypothetical protein